MPGEFITCPDCQGWPSCETGMLCLTCGDDGQVWDEYPDDDLDDDHPMPIRDTGDKLGQVLKDALNQQTNSTETAK